MFRLKKCFSVACLLLLGCSALKNTATINNQLRAIDLKPVGRYYFTNDSSLALVSTAAHFGYTFRGRASTIYVSLSQSKTHNFLQYELDGVYQKRVRIDADTTRSIVIAAPTNGLHTVSIYKTTEAHTDPVLIRKIEAGNVQSVEPPKTAMIEFIGNSITCGAAADASITPCGKGEYHDQHNGYYAYGPRVARTLGVDFMVTAVSGIGIYRTWNRNGPGMPAVYEKTDFFENSSRMWNFKTYAPAVVSIALGTNDLSNGDGKTPRQAFDSSVFITQYVGFVKIVKSHYPAAQIALLNSPMVGGTNDQRLRQCIIAVKHEIDAAFPNDKSVATFFMKPMQSRGCSGHPSVEDHAIIADQLTPFFKSLL